jgi:hypothetical protein
MLARLALAAAALALAGCISGTTSNIDVQDNSVLIPAARIAVDFNERPGPPSHLHTSHALELGVAGGTGSDELRVGAGQQPVVFGGESFAAPQDLKAEFDFRFVDLAYRYRHVSQRRGIGFEALVGAAYARLGLRLSGATQVAAEKLDGGGIVFGLGAMVRLWPSGSIQLRGSGFASGTSEGVSSVRRYEAHFEQALGRHAALRAGWAGYDLRSRREDDGFSSSNRSPIRLRASGPAVGLMLAF